MTYYISFTCPHCQNEAEALSYLDDFPTLEAAQKEATRLNKEKGYDYTIVSSKGEHRK